MRSALPKLLALVIICCEAAAIGQVNPHTQIRWPVGCSAPGVVYNFLSNSCVAIGTAANPAGADTQIQYNFSGIFGATSGLNYNRTTSTLNAPNFNATGSMTAGTSVTAGTTVSAPQHCIGASCITVWPSGNGLPTYGTLLNQSSWTSLTNYTPNGTTPTVSGGALVFTGGSSTLTQSLDWTNGNNYTTNLPLWVETFRETAPTVTSSSLGLGAGLHSNQANGNALEGMAAYVDLSNGANAGKLVIDSYLNTTITQVAISSNALTFSAGDNIQVSCSFNYWTVNCTGNDLTTASTPVTASYTWSFTYPQTVYVPNAAHFTVWNLGGGTLTSLNISSLAPVGAAFMEVGDSKTTGYYQGSAQTTWASQLQANTSSLTIAGSGDGTVDVLNNMPEILALKPQNVILNIGRNDYCSGLVTEAQTQINYASIVSQLQAAGIVVWHLLPIYETVCSQTTFSSWIQSTYASGNLINVPFTSYASSYVIAGDGVHPTPAGANIIYSTVLAALQKGTSPGAVSFTVPNLANGIGSLDFPPNLGSVRVQGYTPFSTGIGVNIGYYTGSGGPFGLLSAYDSAAVLYKALAIGNNQLFLGAGSPSTAHFVGVGTTTPETTLDVTGNGRFIGPNTTDIPVSGTGTEISYSTGLGYGTVQTYNRTGSAFTPLHINASVLSLNPDNASTGSVAIGPGAITLNTAPTVFTSTPAANITAAVTFNDNFAASSGQYDVIANFFAPSAGNGAHIQGVTMGYANSANNSCVFQMDFTSPGSSSNVMNFNCFATAVWNANMSTGAVTFTHGVSAATLAVASARKGTFVCTGGGTITISNTNEAVTSDVIISLNTAGGTITAPPAMKTVTAGTGFTVLCGATDTSTYNYDILN